RSWGISNVFAKEGTFELKIINRWGQEVFSTTDPTERWDGTASGEKAPMGVYVYKLKYQSIDGLPQEERGTFTLIR
ncbi:MAG: gliding motility-associated C-terminal domain-containing protein, partial [Bacteroidota bacterium]|nr:gliding motility-associated C-terminal domain-containing protein [Bacteroidota bacterium]MDX5429306.1 gliding motility-associated C-terminal domain-containing protein [Bacteroidota bacterium]